MRWTLKEVAGFIALFAVALALSALATGPTGFLPESAAAAAETERPAP